MGMLVGRMRPCSRKVWVKKKFRSVGRVERAYCADCPPAGFWRANSVMTMVYD